MQIERQAFWLYNFILQKLQVVLWLAYILSIATLFRLTTYRLEYLATKQTGYLDRCLDTYFDKYKPDRGYLLEPYQLLRIQMITENSLLSQKQCVIKQNEPYSKTASTLYFYEDEALEAMSQQIRKSHKVQELFIAVDFQKIINRNISEYFGVQPIMIDKLTNEMMKRGISIAFLRDFSDQNYLIQLRLLRHLTVAISFIGKILIAILSLVRCLLLSVFCGMLIILLIILGNAALSPMFSLYKRCKIDPNEPSDYLNSSPTIMSIGQHLDLFRNGSDKRHLSLGKYFIIAIYGLTSVIIIGIYGLLNYTSHMLIGGYYKSFNTNGILMFMILEGLGFLFFRTRTSIKYGPSLIVLMYMTAFYLIGTNSYAIPQFYLRWVFWSSIVVILSLVLFIQNPVMKCSDDQIYKPTANRPRAMYFPIFSLTWHNSMAPLWSYFFPQHPREHFHQAELSYVDQNYDLLYSQIMGLPSQINDIEASLEPMEPTGAPLPSFDSDDIIPI